MSIAAHPLADHPVLAPDILGGFQLLEADAGTGKTWTIAGLVVRALVETGLTIDRILVVTFTNAATDELGARIRERIEQLAQLLDDRAAGRASAVDEPFCVAYADTLADPAAARRALRVALAQVDEAAVRTIHAHCRRIIVENALSIGVRLDGQADDRGDAWIVRGVAEWWRQVVDDAPESTLALLAASGVAPGDLVPLLAALDRSPSARVLPAALDWRALALEWHRLRSALEAALERDGADLRAWLSPANKGGFDGQKYAARWLPAWFAALEGFCRGAAGADVLPDAIGRFTSARLAGDGRYAPPALACVSACDALEALRPALADLCAQLALDAWRHVDARRSVLKRMEGGVDHDDLLRIVRDALAREPGGDVLAAALRARHPVALIDECQDTDALQWDIFRRVYAPQLPDTRQGGLVLVGDPKQAIYAFRAADVYTYLAARHDGPSVHALQENQRAVAPLIDAVNALFDREDAFLVPEIRFTASLEGRKPRRRFATRAGLLPAALTLSLLPDGEPGAMLARADALDASVDAAVAGIAALLAPGAAQIDGDPLRPADIAVLVNAHHEGTRIKRALAAAGIGAIEISRDSVLESRECDDLVRIVAAVADPADMGLVRSALVTASAGFDAAGLAELERGPGIAAAIESLAAARRHWAESGPRAALRRLVLAWNVGPRLGGLRDGERRLTNLMHLLDLLASHDEPREGAHAALRWLGRMRTDPSALAGEAGELRLESDDDLVRIVTVHKSKGLEFPVVFVPFAWSGGAPKRRSPRSYHADDGGGWHAVSDLRRKPDPDAERRTALEAHAERLRTLYVALTRARHRCHVCWGAASGAQFSPLAWLLAGLDPVEQAVWKRNAKAPPSLTHASAREGARRWAERANARHAGAVEIVALDARAPRAPVHGGPGDAAHAAGLHARPFAARVPAPWIQTSFTALHALFARDDDAVAPRAVGERPDHDQAVEPVDAAPVAAGRAAPAPAPADIRQAFPSGTLAGVCLHGILEESDFAAGVDAARAAAWLARSGYDTALVPAVVRWLDDVLAAPLPDLRGGTLRLRDLAASSMLREMEFLLPADGVDNARLVDAVADAYPLDAQAAHGRWTGYLRGFVDLVFAHEGRWYIVDWKSNHLGADPARYAPDVLAQAIGTNAYALQFCLYALALHRMLARRVPGYDYARHFGGIHYVFLRGVALPGAPASSGLYATRPPLALIQALDRILGVPA